MTPPIHVTDVRCKIKALESVFSGPFRAIQHFGMFVFCLQE